MQQQVIGIMGAMPEEIDGVVALLANKESFTIGMRTYFKGTINGIQAVVVFSRWGKVAAATTVSTLILKFGITELLFTGVAGAIDQRLRIGDVVIGTHLIQHDMDARPLMAKFEIPLLGKTYFEAQQTQLELALSAVNQLLEIGHLHTLFSDSDLQAFGISQPKYYMGEIASGDKFFASNVQKQDLSDDLPQVLCVEMEGAAVAQVCFEFDIPFAVIRVISDTADDKSHIDFPLFINKISSCYSVELVKNIFHQIHLNQKSILSLK